MIGSDSMKKQVYYVLLFVFILLMILSLISILYWRKDNQKTKEIVSKEEIHLTVEDDRYQLERDILKDNPDTVGWIIIKDTNIYYPVVQTDNNEYYLNHDFSHQWNDAGWIFMDYRNTMNDQNLILYGHHRRDGSMFGSLDSFFDQDYSQKHNTLVFITLDDVSEYEIFSIYRSPADDSYLDIHFESFEEELLKIKNKSEIPFENISQTSQILTLSTCHDNNRDRLVLHFYKKIERNA